MTRELLGIFAPPKQLLRSGLIAAGISGGLLLLHLDSLGLPALSVWFAWWLGGSFGHIAIQPVSYWDRAWPVSHRLLLCTRILAAWLASGVPTLALVVTASALYGLGGVSEGAWARIVLHALCVLGLVPLACAASYRLSDRPQGSPGHVAALILLPALALDAFVTFSGLGEARSVAKLFGPTLIFVVLTGSVGLLLTRVWVASPELASTPARRRDRRPAPPHANTMDAGRFQNALRGPLAFFFLQSRPYALMAWSYFLLFVALAYLYFSSQMWWLGTIIWFQAYSGWQQPSPLPAHLPISRQRILGYMLLPLAVFLSSGLALQHFGYHLASGISVGRYSDDSGRASPHSDELYRIVAPAFVWRASWGEPPLITTPEGVSRRPAAFALLPGLPLNVYNPYDARLDDPTVVNYQASRIMSRQWNLEVSAADVERACHAVQRGHMGRGCLEDQLGKSYERPRLWLAVQCWLLCMIALVTLQTQIGGQGSWAKASRWLSLLWYAPTMIVLPLAMGEVGKPDPTGVLNYPFRVAVLLGELTRLVERAPLASGLVGLVLLLGFYRLVERGFVSMEGFTGRRRLQRSAP